MVGTYYQRNNRIIFHRSKSGQQSSYFEGSKCRQCRNKFNKMSEYPYLQNLERVIKDMRKNLKIPKVDRGKKKEMYGRMRRKLAPDISSSSIIN